jgi:hypothetical protein
MACNMTQTEIESAAEILANKIERAARSDGIWPISEVISYARKKSAELGMAFIPEECHSQVLERAGQILRKR